MSTKLGAAGGMHDIDVELTAEQVDRAPFGRITVAIHWVHLWKSGDRVSITTKDGRQYQGMVLSVSAVTGGVLIELDKDGQRY